MFRLPNSPFTNLKRRPLSAYAHAFTFAAYIVVFAASVTWQGVPALRHDWDWPYTRADVAAYFTNAWSGWQLHGLGYAAPYPTQYIVACVLRILLVFGSRPALVLFLAVIAAVVLHGAWNLTRAGDAPLLRHSIAAFALFNPWVYNKVVAGHLSMVLAYGGTIVLLQSRADMRKAKLAVVAIFSQLQFFVVVFAYLLVRARRKWPALAFAAVLALPVIIGVACEHSELANTPYTLNWQTTQSVMPADGLLLTGYFAPYTARVDILFRIGVLLFLAAALAGNILRRTKHQTTASIFLVLVALPVLIAGGTKGPLAMPYSWLVLNVPESGLFRELYDLLGYTAIGYALLAARSAQKSYMLLAGAAGVALFLVAWVVQPPSSWFVPRERLAQLSLGAGDGFRYALYPAFQPLSFSGLGSGADPNLNGSDGSVALNTYMPLFPEAAALQMRSEKMLGAMSVSLIVSRPGFTQTGSPKTDAGVSGRIATEIAAFPPLTSFERFFENSTATDLTKMDVFAADHVPSAFEVADSPGLYADPSQGWVDARFAFLRAPECWQNLGGEATASPEQSVQLPKGAAMICVRGSLRSSSGVLAETTRGYRWLHISRPTGVRCSGICFIAGFSKNEPQVAPRAENLPRIHAIFMNRPIPWLVISGAIPSGDKALRFNERFDPWWVGFQKGRIIQHERVDQTFNGWTTDGSTGTVILVESVAAAQFLFQMLALVFAAGLLLQNREPTARISNYSDQE